jgi:ankyrin repeat protein
MIRNRRFFGAAGFALFLTLLIANTGCKIHKAQPTPEAARAELQRQGVDYSEETFLNNAKDGNTDVVNLFLDAGMEPDVIDKDGGTALIYAAAMDNADMIRNLLARGADLHAKGFNNDTALIHAALTGSCEAIKILLDAGADVNMKSSHGTPLILAAFLGYHECVKILLERGADINAQTDEGETGLMLLVVYTKDAKSDIKESINGKMLSSMTGIDRLKTAKLLLDKGADVNVKNKKGKTALMLAEEKGNLQMVELLKQAETV